MICRSIVFGVLIIRTMVSSSIDDEFRRSSDPIAKALTSYGYHIEYPTNNNYTCLSSNKRDCYRLEFEIRSPVSRALSARLFMHQDSTSLRNISLLWPLSSENSIIVENNWVYYEVTPCLRKVQRNEFHCSIEYSGDGEELESLDEPLPFLVVSSGVRSRRRRTTSTCTIEDRIVDSKDLGKGDDVLPLRINLKACVGECPVNAGTFTDDYAHAMYFYHKKKRLHIPDESWKPTCQITGMESINLFFKTTIDGNVTFVEKKVENLVVTSCGCRIHMCNTP